MRPHFRLDFYLPEGNIKRPGLRIRKLGLYLSGAIEALPQSTTHKREGIS